MLEKLTLRNYRGFNRHTLPLRPSSIIVGENNAGKSTILEALKLVSIVVNRAPYLNYLNVPDWLDMPVGYRGVSPSLAGIDFDFRNVCHNYSAPPAIIKAEFAEGHKVDVYLNPKEEEIFAVIAGPDRKPIFSKSQAIKLQLPAIHVLPPVGPLALREKQLAADYVRASLGTNLAPIHFRNQLFLLYDDHFERFVELAEHSWPHLAINGLDSVMAQNEREIHLFVRDLNFVAEAGWLGHGLQAWLQIIWFLARTSYDSTIILDEPDIYMHADLQRKLIRLLGDQFKQMIIATHSIEIMAEVNPESILVVDKRRQNSKFATSLPSVQQVVENIGGVHNLQLSRLWSARKCIFVEGNDLNLLNIFHRKLFPETQESLGSAPNISIGGTGNWKHAVGASIGLKNAGDQGIKTYCILDSDYRLPEQIEAIRSDAIKHGLQIHIWTKKEIENYLLIPEAVHRYIHNNKIKKSNYPKIDIIKRRIEKICNNKREDILAAIGDEALKLNRSGGFTSANKVANQIMNTAWNSFEGMAARVAGKDVISELSKWSKQNYGVSFSALSIAHAISTDEIDAEIACVIDAIENLRDFSHLQNTQH